MKTINSECKQFVNKCQPFQGNNLSGVRVSDTLYVVYSYGYWPIWAKIKNQWYGHKQKYSRTTSAHTTQSKPESRNIHMLDTVEQLKENIAAAN